MAAAAALTLGGFHLLLAIRQRSRVNLLFFLTAVSAAALAALELTRMRVQTPEQFGAIVRAMHIPIFVLVFSLVSFVRIYFRAGRPWLAWTVIAVRGTASLVINFLQSPNLNYRQITGIRRLPFLGEQVSVAEGIVSPWTRLGELASLLLLVFLIDATVTVWKRGDRRRVGIGLGMIFFILSASVMTSLQFAGILRWPSVITFGYLGLVAVMTFDLAHEVFRANQLSRELETSASALREREGLLALASAVPDLALWSWDVEKDEIWMTANGRALRGLEPEERLDFERVMSCLHPEDRDGYEHAIRESLETRESFQRECRLLGADGVVHWITGIGRADSDAAGAMHVFGVSIDVTARKLAEIEAHQQRVELAHLSRVATLEALSGSLAHELNQPLTAILSNAQAAQRFLAKNGGNLGEVREILEDIVKEDKHAGEVIRRLRPLLKKGEVNLETIDLREVIEESLRVVRSDLIHRGVSLETQFAGDLPAVRADRVQIQQVLLNLVTNSCDAMADAEPTERRILLRVEATGSGPHVTVSDRGCGVAPDDVERIFEPFVTTKPDGIGLGLAVCRSIIAAHGGRLWAANNPEGGAKFQFQLPSGKGAS